MTVGVGWGIDEGIAFSIHQQRPDKVVFVCTPQSRERYSQRLREICEREGVESEEIIVGDPNYVDQLTKDLCKILKGIKSQAEELLIDITFGTKALTAALYLAGFIEGASGVSYVYGEREPKTGRAISGSEGIILGRFWAPSIILAGKRAVQLHNAFLFGSALSLAKELLRIADNVPEWALRAKVFYNVVALAYHWDRFNFAEAGKRVGEFLAGDAEQQLKTLWEMVVLPGKPNREAVEGLAKYLRGLENPLNPALAWELVRSAERRASIGFWEDAVARLYRTVEFVGQVSLAQKGYYDGKVFKGVKAKVPESARAGVESDTEVLGLRDIYRRLKALGSELGDVFIAENYEIKSEVGEVLAARNRSILAHGFRPAGKEVYEKFRELALKAIEVAGISEPIWKIPKLKEGVF